MMIALPLILLNAMRYARDSTVANFGERVALVSSLLTILFGLTCLGRIRTAPRVSAAGVVRQTKHLYKSFAVCFQLFPTEGVPQFLCVEDAPLFLQDGNVVRVQFVEGSDTVTYLSDSSRSLECHRSDGTDACIIIISLGIAFFLWAIVGGPSEARQSFVSI
jgi:hypothetical protein